MEVGVTIAQNEKKLFGEQCSAGEDDRAEKNHDASNSSIQITQLALVLTTCKSRDENVRQHVRQHGEDHGKTTKRSDFCDRCCVTTEKTDQDHGDLTLKTIKQCVRGQTFDQPYDLVTILRVFVRL